MQQNMDYKTKIQGWGADLDHKNRPAYPMERTPPRLPNGPVPPPEQQAVTVTKLKSTERPALTPIIGTTLPPVGLSGMIRKAAFKLSENDIRHWMMLLFADRVNMVEGIVSDLGRGHIPNIYKEMGLASEFKHNKKKAIQFTMFASALLITGIYLMRPKKA